MDTGDIKIAVSAGQLFNQKWKEKMPSKKYLWAILVSRSALGTKVMEAAEENNHSKEKNCTLAFANKIVPRDFNKFMDDDDCW